MRRLQKLMIVLVATLCGGLMLIKNTFAQCTKENKEHEDRNIVCCPYSQKDLTRMHQKNPDRIPCEDVCCYCGCQKEYHTQK